jgi:hypothetical protein
MVLNFWVLPHLNLEFFTNWQYVKKSDIKKIALTDYEEGLVR